MSTSPEPLERFKSSDLSRNSKRVFAAAEAKPITITRRDGGSLVLMSQKQNESREDLLQLAMRVLSATRDDHGSMIERLARQYPWMLVLSDDDRAACTAEILDATHAALSTGEPAHALITIDSWKSTAEAIASGRTPAVDWHATHVPVKRP